MNVSDTAFEVGLSFGACPKSSTSPSTPVKGFFDPSVQFGLQFDPRARPRRRGRGARRIRPDAAAARAVEPAPAPEQAAPAATSAEASDKPPKNKPEATPGENAGAAVVSLDAFRRKT